MSRTARDSDRGTTTPALEVSIARCRVLLSTVAILAVYVDPTEPTLTRWLALRGGPFTMDPWALGVMTAHLAYSVGSSVALTRGLASPSSIARTTTWADVPFGALIALVTEGANSPFYAFFAFAVVAVGLRAGMRSALVVTAASVVLYLSLIAVSAPQNANSIIMRPVYLAITGYLVGYLGEQRLRLANEVRELEHAAERERIARSLHDGYAQALAGVNLRLESCRELLRRGRHDDALGELGDLQGAVNREYDDLRAYIRSLVDLEADTGANADVAGPRFSVTADFAGSAQLVEHVLQIMLEGVRNVRRHAGATNASVTARAIDGRIRLVVEDDGVGFPEGASPPWSIASRVGELAGALELRSGTPSGAQLCIEVSEA